MHIERNGITIELTVGDIARQADVAAVVNAANAQLMPGSGVAGAIHDAAGPQLASAARAYAPLEPGEAVMTPAYELPNRFVVHCLGPVYGRDKPADVLLASCYRNALELADERELTSIAFPALSTGAFGYPMEEAAEVAMRVVGAGMVSLQHVRLIRFVLFAEKDRIIHEQALRRQFPDARQ